MVLNYLSLMVEPFFFASLRFKTVWFISESNHIYCMSAMYWTNSSVSGVSSSYIICQRFCFPSVLPCWINNIFKLYFSSSIAALTFHYVVTGWSPIHHLCSSGNKLRKPQLQFWYYQQGNSFWLWLSRFLYTKFVLLLS